MYLTYLTYISYNATFEISVLSLSMKAMDPYLPGNAQALVLILLCISQLLYKYQYVPYLQLLIWLFSAVAYIKEIVTFRKNQL